MSEQTNETIQIQEGQFRFKEGYFLNDENKDVYYKIWMPLDESAPIVANMIFLHGYAEHINRYNNLFTEYTKIGIKVHSFDQIGHGLTAKKNNTFGEGNTLAKVLKHVDFIMEKIDQPELPLILSGHSWGGACSLNYLAAGKNRHRFHAALMTSPCVRIAKQSGPNHIFHPLLEMVANVIPWFKITSPVDPNYVSKIPAEVELYKNDPLIYDSFQLSQAKELLIGGRELSKQKYKLIKVPYLYVIHGDDDKVADYFATKELMNNIISNKNVAHPTFLTVEKGRHELHHDSDKEQTIKGYKDWLTNVIQHFPASPSTPPSKL